jgi:acetolactate synthase small subunit
MVLCQVRVQLPDRPGSLGRVTSLLGRLGVNINQLLVLDRDGDLAVDDLLVEAPGEVVYRCLAEMLEELPGVRVLQLTRSDAFAVVRPVA